MRSSGSGTTRPGASRPFVDFAGIDAYPRPGAAPDPHHRRRSCQGFAAPAVTRGHGWYGFMTTPESTARASMRCAMQQRASNDRRRWARSRSP
jgi:hypothetical protein